MSHRCRPKSEKDFMLEWIDEFAQSRGDGPISLMEVAAWIFREKKWKPGRRQILNDLSQRLARAAKRKYHVDAQGRRVRSFHAAKYPRVDKNGQMVFETMWDHAEVMSAEHARVSFTQRWQLIAGSCHSLRRDIDSFNENNPRAVDREVQLCFNFEFESETPSAQVVESLSEDVPV